MATGTAVDLCALAWAAWAEGDGALASGGRLHAPPPLPASLRRRVTPVGRRALEVAWVVLAGRWEAQPRIILSSRHGEFARTHDLLHELVQTGEVSPAEFSLAVHHGLAGLLSIATGNRAGHTAVAAGTGSFFAGLLEAASVLAEGEGSVLLMHFDESLPESHAAIGGEAEGCALALALLLTAGGDGIPVALESGCDAATLARRLSHAA